MCFDGGTLLTWGETEAGISEGRLLVFLEGLDRYGGRLIKVFGVFFFY